MGLYSGCSMFKKYHEGLGHVKEVLRKASRKQLKELLETVGLSEIKQKIIIMRFCEEKTRLFIAGELNITEKIVSIKTTEALNKIKTFLEHSSNIK